MKQELGKETQAVLELVTTAQSMTIGQVRMITNGTKAIPDHIANLLCFMRAIRVINKEYLIPFNKKKVEYGGIACLWVIFDLLQYDDGTINLDDLQSIINGNSLVNMTYIQDENSVVNVIYVDNNTFTRVIAAKQHMDNYKQEDIKTPGLVHVFVTTDTEVALKIQKSNLDFPHKIAILNGDMVQEAPEITYI